MELSRVQEVVDGLPFMSIEQARTITDLIIDQGCRDVLELGIMYGVSTCYMAAALDGTGRDWHITTIDNTSAAVKSPNVEELLTTLGLRERVTVHYEPTSYTWRLMKMLEEDPTPRFDFCYLDGAHSWNDDGFAFFLVDRLMKPGGWIVFDDIEWSYSTSPSLRDTDRVKAMPDDEREARQVKKIFELLVRTHPNYGEFSLSAGWGLARKVSEGVVIEQVGLGAVALRAYRKVRTRLSRRQRS